jgi:hypothetical protein
MRILFACISRFLAVPACAEEASTSIVFVEAVQKNETSASYRMVHLSADGKKRELAASLQEPVELLQCSDETVTYVESQWAYLEPRVAERHA